MAGCQGSLTIALLLLPAALWRAVASEEARELSSDVIHFSTDTVGKAAPAGSAHALAEASWEGHLAHRVSIPTAAPAAVTNAPVPTPAPTAAPVPTPAPPVVPAGPGSSGKPHLGLNSLGYETIPRHVKLKYKLIQWFENQRQCPLNMEGGFPAWVGWKAVTAATPAITTPPKGVAGFRTLIVDGFCPNMQSSDFKCVRTGNEIKARAITRTAHLALDNVRCTMQDISLYRMEDGMIGVRFDFASCGGNSHIGALAPHVPQSASLNMGLVQQRVGEASVNFNEFFNAVCNDGPAADFVTALLPKLARVGPATGLPSCFAETANTAHVIGKGCYEDFIFFEMEDLNGRLATIPATDLQALSQMIPASQQYSHHAARPAPAPVPAPAMMSGPVGQASGQVLTAPSNPYQKPTCSQYQCQAPFTARPDPDMYLCHEQTGCTMADRTVCCVIPTTTTTTPATVEVPGVVVADRVCLFFKKCGCNNLCDCSAQPENL